MNQLWRAVVTAADMVAGHVTLDISCRTGYTSTATSPSCRRPAASSTSFTSTGGKPIASPALFEPIGEKFRRDIKDWAQANGIPVTRFKAGERKCPFTG